MYSCRTILISTYIQISEPLRTALSLVWKRNRLLHQIRLSSKYIRVFWYFVSLCFSIVLISTPCNIMIVCCEPSLDDWPTVGRALPPPLHIPSWCKRRLLRDHSCVRPTVVNWCEFLSDSEKPFSLVRSLCKTHQYSYNFKVWCHS